MEKTARSAGRALEVCESRGGHSELPVPNSPHGLCGRKATLNTKQNVRSAETEVYINTNSYNYLPIHLVYLQVSVV